MLSLSLDLIRRNQGLIVVFQIGEFGVECLLEFDPLLQQGFFNKVMYRVEFAHKITYFTYCPRLHVLYLDVNAILIEALRQFKCVRLLSVQL